MKKSEVKTKLELIESNIKQLINDDEISLYITSGRYIPDQGYVKDLQTIEEVVIAHSVLMGFQVNPIVESMKALGVKESEMNKIEDKIFGFKYEHWLKDLNTRLAELRKVESLKNLQLAKSILQKHLSEDDKFELDTKFIDDVLGV